MSIAFDIHCKYNGTKLAQIIDWLETNVGAQHYQWIWGCKEGTVFILDEKVALAFALVWGVK